MTLRATLLTLMLAALGLIALAPGASATCLDTNPDDNGIGTQDCNVPAVGDCKVLVYGNLPGLGQDCLPVDCVRECGPPADSATDASGTGFAGPCSNDLDPPDDTGILVRCSSGGISCRVGALAYGGPLPHYGCWGPIYCVTEPCHYPLFP
jgi:hypothetical protein